MAGRLEIRACLGVLVSSGQSSRCLVGAGGEEGEEAGEDGLGGCGGCSWCQTKAILFCNGSHQGLGDKGENISRLGCRWTILPYVPLASSLKRVESVSLDPR